MKDSTKVLLIAAVMFTFATIAAANHSWGNRHWARQQNPLLLDIGNNLSSAWGTHLRDALVDWNTPPVDTDIPTVLITTMKPGNGSAKCLPTKGRVEVCDGAGRSTLGFARVWLRNDHIEQAIVRLSDYHLLTPGSKYNTPAFRQLVVCQEVGHTFGLDHQDEDSYNPNVGSCMDYTTDPDGTISDPDQLSDERPNRHDFEQLATIYAHLDTFNSSSSQAGTASLGNTGKLEDSSEWGKGIRRDARGRTSLYELNLGRGEKVMTFVLWAD
jgi:hypothetical protein